MAGTIYGSVSLGLSTKSNLKVSLTNATERDGFIANLGYSKDGYLLEFLANMFRRFKPQHLFCHSTDTLVKHTKN